MNTNRECLICRYTDLERYDYLTRICRFRGQQHSIIVFLFENRVYAYANLCSHQKRKLDCEADTVFDRSGRYLQCSSHGCTFEPTTGTCISPVCQGQRLKAIPVIRQGSEIYLQEEAGGIV